MLRKYIIVCLWHLISLCNAFASEHGGGGQQVAEDKTNLVISALRDDKAPFVGGNNLVQLLFDEVVSINPTLRSQCCVDPKSSLGQISNYLYLNNINSLWKMDLPDTLLALQKKQYPGIKIASTDIKHLTSEYDEGFFDVTFVCMGASPHKDRGVLWQKVKNISKYGGLLAVIDFKIFEKEMGDILKKPDNKAVHPLYLDDTLSFLKFIGWDVLVVKDVTPEFKRWHLSVLEDLKKNTLALEEMGMNAIEISFVHKYLSDIVELLDKEKIGGTIIIAKKI